MAWPDARTIGGWKRALVDVRPKDGTDAGFSDAMRGGLGGALLLPGVGEARRHEIAG
jgi:hypothetical protein